MALAFMVMVVIVIFTTNVVLEVDGESRLGAKPMLSINRLAESMQPEWSSLLCVVIWFIGATAGPMTLLSASGTFSATEQALLRKAFWWCSIPVSSPTRLWVGLGGGGTGSLSLIALSGGLFPDAGGLCRVNPLDIDF